MHFDPATWGTAGQWFSSALTSGSLLLGYRILRINQRDKRRDQSAKVTFAATLSLDSETEFLRHVRGHIYNDSDALVSGVAIRVDYKEAIAKTLPWNVRFTNPLHRLISYQSLSDGHDGSSNLMPGRNGVFSLELRERVRVTEKDVDVALMFTDANNVTWERPLNQPVHEFHFWKRPRLFAVGAVLAWIRTKDRIKALIKR